MENPRLDEDSTSPDAALLEELNFIDPINAESREADLKAALDGLDNIHLSEGEDRFSMLAYELADFRKKLQVMGASTTPQNLYPKHDDDWYESFPKPNGIPKEFEQVLDSLADQYADLPKSCRQLGDKVYSWDEILEANPRLKYDFMVAGRSLNRPAPYFINEKGWMVFGDRKLDESTLNVNYIDNKINAMHGHGRDMITFQEFLRRFETVPSWGAGIRTWFESGPLRIRASYGGIHNGRTNRGLISPTKRETELGALRVVRVPMNLPE